MLKLGIQLEEKDDKLNIKLLDPTKKQLDSASEFEKITAQVIKEVLDNNLLNLMNEYNTEKEN